MPKSMKRNNSPRKNKSQEEETSLKKQVQNLMKNFEWVIIGRDWCPACRNAKKFAKKNNLNYAYLDLDDSVNEKAYGTYIHPVVLKSKPTWNTIPIVFYNGTFIGGGDELEETFNNRGKNVQMNTFRKFMSSGEIVVHKYIPEDFDY